MYQFVRVESYGFKVSEKKSEKKYNKENKGRNVEEIIKELKRVPGFCDHVPFPDDEPEVLYGVSPDEIEALTHNYFDNTKTIDSLGRPRALRKDAQVLLAGVISLNREIDMIWDDYKQSSIDWLKEKYGDRLVSVVQHLDEENPHIHFYCIPKIGEKFEVLHEGKKAYAEVGGKLKYKKEKAYVEAMRKFQEDFFLKVAAGYGLMKTGPRRQRLSNADYWNQKREIELINQHKKKIKDDADLLLNSVNEQIESQKKKANSEIVSLKETATAAGMRIGKRLGYKDAIKDFEGKNYFNRLIFSKKHNEEMIALLEKRNNDLKEKNKNLFNRKEKYKAEGIENSIYKNKYEEERKKVEYFEVINDFINDGNEKEVNYDIRRAIIAEIKAVEEQQQRFNKGIEQVKSRNDINVRKANSIGERVGKSFRVLFRNLNSFIGDFFGVELFERMFKKEKTNNIEKFKYKEPEQKEKQNQELKKDRRLIVR
ncbi:plasmid recombination protein [Citrobacter freundii]|uniref:plasmid recombination protein n=1 Tax=Citrobacter freundii TaxID=546 RepID=UPI0034E4B0C7